MASSSRHSGSGRPGSGRRTGDPVTVADSLAVWRRRLGVAEPSDMARLAAIWGEVMGPLASSVEPRALVDGTLRVVVEDPVAVAAVRLRAEGWVAEFHRRLGTQLVRRIDVRVQR